MEKKRVLDDPKPTFIVSDSILAGILKAKGCRVDPAPSEDGQIIFIVHGDAESTLHDVYDNAPVGARDALEGVKSCRAAIFTLKRSL